MTELVDLDALRASAPFWGRAIPLVEGLCLNAMDVRSEILLHLSADDGEWSEGNGLPKLAKQYRRLIKLAFKILKDSGGDNDGIFFTAMTKAAKQMKQPEELPW